LERCHYSHPLFKSVKPLTFWSSLKCASLRLWDEESRRLVGYSHLKKLQQA
jgi:omega-6 fatty acid desaturase (delta-12 desaturase)